MTTYTKSRKYPKELFLSHVSNVYSIAELIKSFGLKPSGGNYRHFQKLCRLYDIDTSHFTGARWNKGKTLADHPSLAKASQSLRMPSEEVLSENSAASTRLVRRVLLEQGIVYQCSECDNDGSWLGKPLTLHIDHINGINNDNRINNLRFICPNCHQQTPTWGCRKR